MSAPEPGVMRADQEAAIKAVSDFIEAAGWMDTPPRFHFRSAFALITARLATLERERDMERQTVTNERLANSGLLARIHVLEREREALRNWLYTYAAHPSSCRRRMWPSNPCDCDLSVLLAPPAPAGYVPTECPRCGLLTYFKNPSDSNPWCRTCDYWPKPPAPAGGTDGR